MKLNVVEFLTKTLVLLDTMNGFAEAFDVVSGEDSKSVNIDSIEFRESNCA